MATTTTTSSVTIDGRRWFSALLRPWKVVGGSVTDQSYGTYEAAVTALGGRGSGRVFFMYSRDAGVLARRKVSSSAPVRWQERMAAVGQPDVKFT